MEFLSPKYLSEAYEILDKQGDQLKVCGGMTHLLRFYKNFPTELGDRFKGFLHVGDLEGLSECQEENGRFVLGSTARISSLAEDPYLARYAYAVLEAARVTSTPQIRNRRTLGGELAWGSYHSPLIAALLALEAKVKIRSRGKGGAVGREEILSLEDLYIGETERQAVDGGENLVTRKVKTESQDLILRVVLPNHQPGAFSFFRALSPKIQTENSGVVVAVSGAAQNGTILHARMVASGIWMKTMQEVLPLDGTRMSDTHIYERLYTFCDRFAFDKLRRSGPPGNQLGLIVFGLLKEGFSHLLGR